MCDETELAKIIAHHRQYGLVSRRRLTATLGAAAFVASCGTEAPEAGALTSQNVTIETPEGQADCYLTHPARGTHPAVLIWPDAFGRRQAFHDMADRLAMEGYVVLVTNPFYRTDRAPQVEHGSARNDQAVVKEVIARMQTLTPATTRADSKTFLTYLAAHGAVDSNRKMGVAGYCMGGAMAIRTAAALSDQVGAFASFHGFGLVTDAPDSPHRRLEEVSDAQALIAIAADDHQKDLNAKPALEASCAKLNIPAEIAVYDGTKHGWCPPDMPMHNATQADRAFERHVALLSRSL